MRQLLKHLGLIEGFGVFGFSVLGFGVLGFSVGPRDMCG